MADQTGPPQGTIPLMKPFPIADDGPPPKPIPDIWHPEKTPAERAAKRFSLEGKRAIVTGGAQGLGLVCARALLEHGVSHMAIFDLNEQLGAEAEKHLTEHALRGSGGLVVFHKVDVTDEKAVDEAVLHCAIEFDGIDVLLCFAGITDCQSAIEYKIEDWKRIFDVNINGSFLVARAVARNMIANEVHGSIVFTASMSGYIANYPQPHSAYAVSKAGVHHLTRSMAAEWVGHHIRVNSISPGIMNTRLTAGDAQAGLRQLWMERSPMGRMGDPEDLTGAVVLLCSEAGRFMTGTDIKIDGGYTIF